MDILVELKDKLNIDKNEFIEIKQVVFDLEQILCSYGILFDEQLKLGFYSHIVSLVRRLKENRSLMDVNDNSILEQIDKRSIDIANILIKPIFERYNSSYSYSEVILIAVYIQTAMAKDKGGRTNE